MFITITARNYTYIVITFCPHQKDNSIIEPTKAALNAITIAQAQEYGPKVRVNAILPGAFRTDISKAWPKEKEAELRAAIPRYGEPEEIVTSVLYLASDHSSYTTGTLIRVDGGRRA